MFKAIFKFFKNKMSCASIVGAQGINLLKNSNLMLQSANAELTDAGLTVSSFMTKFIEIFVEIINSWIYIIAKHILQFIDFCQVITYKVAGIDNDLEKIVDLPLFKFLLNDIVLKTIGAIMIVGLIILILATIIAIIKSEYEAALDDKFDAKRAAKKTLGKSVIALFLMMITPFIVVIAIIFSSVVLSSINNVLNSNQTQQATIGGTLFKTSAYNANKYRIYATDGKRIPIVLNFDDPYENGTYVYYSPEELAEIYEGWNGEEIYDDFARGRFQNFNDTLVYRDGKVYNSSTYSDYERFSVTSEQYQVMADFIDYAVANEFTYYIKNSTDDDVDWSRMSSDIKISDGVYDPVRNTISITYADMSNLAPYEDYYTITFETSTASADTPIENAVKTISLILGLNSILNDHAVQAINANKEVVGPVGVTTNTSLAGSAAEIDDTLKQLASASQQNGNTTKFRILERVKGSLNVVRWQTEKAIYNGQEFTVYELKKVQKNDQTGIKENKATIKVAKKDDSLNGKYYVVSEEPNSLGYYDYTNVTIDYFNDGKIYYDELTPIYKMVTWPEKLYNDLAIIYADIDFDNYLVYDNWADALGEYFKTNTNVTKKDVSTFATTLIHPLGLIMSELFLGTTLEGVNGTTAEFSFTSAYLEDTIDAIALSVGGEFEFGNIKNQIASFERLFNAQFASVIDSLRDIENFDLQGNDHMSVQGYVYKAYLSSIMLSTEYTNYLYDIAKTLLTGEKVIELMSLISGSEVYDDTGKQVYKITRLTNADGSYIPIYYMGEENSGKAVYNSNGKLYYAANERGRLDPRGIFIPKQDVHYEIVKDGDVYRYRVYAASKGEYVLASTLVTNRAYEEFMVEVEAGRADAKDAPLKFFDYFEPYYTVESGNALFVWEPADGDTSKLSTTVNKVMLMSNAANHLQSVQNWHNGLVSIIATNEGLDEYFLYEVESVLDIDYGYLTYDRLPKVYQEYIDKIIVDITNDAEAGMYQPPKYLDFLIEYQQDGAEMVDIMNAKPISSKDAEKYLEDYDEIVRMIDYYTALLNEPLTAAETVRAYNNLQKQKDKLYQLKKYYITYGIQSYASTQVSAGFNVVVNGHPFQVSQGMVQRELLEVILGNKLTFVDIIAKIDNNTAYKYLEGFDEVAFSLLAGYVDFYADEVRSLAGGANPRLFGGKLSDSELEIVNKVYSIKTGKIKNFTNRSLKNLESDEKESLKRVLNLTALDVKTIKANYIAGKTVNTGTSYALTIDESFQLLKAFMEMGAANDELFFVSGDNEGIIGDDLEGFDSLKHFLKGFGELCFDLARESNLGGVGQHETEDLLDYVDDLTAILLARLEALDLGNGFETFATIDEVEDLKTVIGELSESTRFNLLDSSSKQYIYYLYDVYNKKIQEYAAELEVYKNARDYSTRYINGRYAMQADSFVFTVGLKNYLNYFRYHTDLMDEDFAEKYVYDGYGEIGDQIEDRLFYYNLYLEAFDNVVLGTNGVYFDSLTDLQQKVMRDMSAYYKKQYDEFSEATTAEHSEDVYGFELLNAFIYEGASFGEKYYVKATAGQKNMYDLVEENIALINLFNMLEFLGLEYSPEKTLADYRLDAMNMLVSFTERAGESGAAIQARYLSLLNLACADYSTNALGEKVIMLDLNTKATIIKLAGLENKAEENLVGLKYESIEDNVVADEKYGSVFIICTYNSETNLYEPFVFASEKDSFGTPSTNYYSSADGKIKYFPVIAKGVIGPDGLPTAIREVNGYIEFYRESVTIVDAGSLGIDMYYMSVEDVAINYNPVNLLVNVFAKIVTGKTAVQLIYDSIPVVVSSKNINFAYGTKTNYVYHLDGGEFTLNYMFFEDSGIHLNCLYKISEINSLILVLGTLILATTLISAMFGVIRNLYELLLIIMIYPGVLGMYPLKDGMQGNWRKQFIDKLLIMFGYIIAINGFFLILNMLQRMEIAVMLSPESLAELKNTYLFGLFDLQSVVSTLMTFMFFIVACTLLKTLPGFFSKMIGGTGDVVQKGQNTQKLMETNFEEASYFSSGYAIADMISSKTEIFRKMPLVGTYARMDAKEALHVAKNKRAVSKYRARLEDTGRQKLKQEASDDYRRRLNATGRFNSAQIDSAVEKFEAKLEQMDMETMVQTALKIHEKELIKSGAPLGSMTTLMSNYEKKIRGYAISANTINAAVKAYETSLARQVEAERNRRMAEFEARDARISKRKDRLKAAAETVKKEHRKDKKAPKVCPNCHAVCGGKSKACPRCGYKF